ncbi:DUF389 domain-containing protein [Flavobacteriaceae bacterium F89]|uniref:DUF389 domain-containing protein n=1 Tax=Cerina litoralis TaxID=2874477 RepID=A0AAE3EX38_9FLAO|nr:DUF389 domain-containing protein [Cerina litoralis]MCG2461724.1 DUF389 domain-containing protein [Cerina litoralis]
MEQNLNQDNITPTSNNGDTQDDVKKDFKGLLGSTTRFLSELLDIRTNTDQEATKESIIADIPFKGHTSWILICSIFIASVGLNANSTAVVIGAMLISPLMGPILGMGLSLAINDIDTLRRSIKNFGVMVVLSVITAFLFFWLFPLRAESSELLARTAPDIRDVLIAFFGGLALVIARAKKGTIASVIFGVAIATALMPPLCTVGFGLAIGNLGYASGAMYLFIINTIFIGLATFLVIKFLRFPMVRYVNSKRRSMIARIASVVAILVMVPAMFTFYNVFQESIFTKQANDFINRNVVPYNPAGDTRFLKNFTHLDFDKGRNPTIELVFMGNESVPDNVIDTWRTQMESQPQLRNTKLKVVQGSKSGAQDELKYLSELYESKKSELQNKDEKIQMLETEVIKLSKNATHQIPFKEISEEAKTNYENLEEFGFANIITTDFNKLDTLPIFEVKWKKDIKRKQIDEDAKRLEAWLKLRLKNNKLRLKEVKN